MVIYYGDGFGLFARFFQIQHSRLQSVNIPSLDSIRSPASWFNVKTVQYRSISGDKKKYGTAEY